MPHRIDAIDISHWNKVTDLRQVFEAGVVGVIHKCTEGTDYVDPTYSERMTEAAIAGLLWGAYHFLKHGNATEQMRWFLENAQLPPGARVVIDYEDADCVLDDLQEAIFAIADIDPTMQVTVYSGHLIKDQVGNKCYPDLQETSLWLAQYTSGEPSWPKNTWAVWSLWQFTDKGSCPGIEGNCDLNTFNGDLDQCAAWFGPVVEPAPPPAGAVVEIVVTVPEGIEVNVTVNKV